MQLVVKQLSFNIRASDRSKLTAAGGISGGHASNFVHMNASSVNDGDSRLNHDLVDDLWVALHLELTRLADAHEAGEQGLSWDAHVVEPQVAIVDAVVAELCADVANLDTWKRLVRFEVSDGHDEWLHTVVSLKSDAASEDDGVCCLYTEVTWPELGGLEGRRMENELVSGHIKLCGSLKTSDV